MTNISIEFIISGMQSMPITSTFFVVICLDLVLGILLSIKRGTFNSSFGIDGALRKIAMIFGIVFLFVIDFLLKINMIWFLPEEIKTFIGLPYVGMSTFFSIVFIIYEFVSITKHAAMLNVPIPEKIINALEHTAELLDKDEDTKKDAKKDDTKG